MNRSPSSLPSPQDILNTLTHNTYKPFCLHHTTTFLLISQPPGASASIIYSCEGAGCWSSCPLFTMMSDDSQNSSGAGGRRSAGAAASAAAAMRPPEQGLKCPRCDSPNTKFCYYNNYSLSQPRHFCKTCRRYWTKGGALRNVPVGGGCRKNKKSKSPASSRLPLVDPTDPMARFPEFHGGHKFLNVSPPPLAADFHIGLLPFSRLQAPATASGIFGSNQFMSFGDISTASNAAISSSVGASITAPMLGLNYPISDLGLYNEIGGGNTGSSSSSAANGSAHSNSIVSSIESLSSINQDLHWKLQQQRMATLFGGKAQKEGSSSIQSPALGNHQEDNSSFRMAERSKDENCATGINRSHSSPAWFLEGSCTMSIATTSPPTTTNNNITSSNNNMNTSNWTGITTWNDMPQFTTL